MAGQQRAAAHSCRAGVGVHRAEGERAGSLLDQATGGGIGTKGGSAQDGTATEAAGVVKQAETERRGIHVAAGVDDGHAGDGAIGEVDERLRPGELPAGRRTHAQDPASPSHGWSMRVAGPTIEDRDGQHAGAGGRQQRLGDGGVQAIRIHHRAALVNRGAAELVVAKKVGIAHTGPSGLEGAAKEIEARVVIHDAWGKRHAIHGFHEQRTVVEVDRRIVARAATHLHA